MKALIVLAAILLTACSKPAPDPRAELARIISHPKSAAWTGKIISIRTEPTVAPSHSAILEAREQAAVYRFSTFCKDGIWYYGEPLSLVDGGEPISITGEDYFTHIFAIAASNLNLRR